MNTAERNNAIKGIIEVLERAKTEKPNLKIYCNPKTWEALIGTIDAPSNVCINNIVPEGKMYACDIDDIPFRYKHYPYTFDPNTTEHEPVSLPKIVQ